MYLVWYDDDSRKSIGQKIEAAIAAYVGHFTRRPRVVLVHAAEQAGHPGVQVQSAPFVRRDHYWVGQDGPPVTGGMAATTDTDSTRSAAPRS